jgi:hypothetical protein
MNYIFGSGIVGLVAKKVLQGDWTIVPFRRSRFYSFNPPLADNFIGRDPEIDELIKDLTGSNSLYYYYRAFSVNGQLQKTYDPALCSTWLTKIFGDRVPGQSLPYMATRMIQSIYGVRTNLLYQHLLKESIDTLKAQSALGDVTEVGDHYFIRGGQRYDFDHLISTIPLPALMELAGTKETGLESKTEYYFHVSTPSIDFEGCNQVLVVDPEIKFYKSTNVAKDRYMFFSTEEIPVPGSYFAPIIGTADIIDGTQMVNAIPTGNLPNLDSLSAFGIFCIGSCAQWDPWADVGSNLLRLVRYAKRGYASQ